MKIILFWYVLLSVVTFVLYAVDKSAAIHQRWRIRERTLHILSVVGGWPGAIIGQKLFRHKTQKRSFRTIFWLTVTTNILAVFSVFGYPFLQHVFIR